MTKNEEHLVSAAVRAAVGFIATFNRGNIRRRLETQGLSEEDIATLTRVIYDQAAPFFELPEDVPEEYVAGEDYHMVAIYSRAGDF